MSERRICCKCEKQYVATDINEGCPYCRIEELQAALRTVSESKPVGDTGYRYGYAWEFCVMTASRALHGG